jgi:hypothetical protein
MKLTISILSLLNGIYMLADGIYVMLKGKYIGPEKPGPWAWIFSKLNVDVFKLGPLFLLLGLCWLVFLFAYWTSQPWAWWAGVIMSILTLWYLPFGTIISLALLIILLRNRA